MKVLKLTLAVAGSTANRDPKTSAPLDDSSRQKNSKAIGISNVVRNPCSEGKELLKPKGCSVVPTATRSPSDEIALPVDSLEPVFLRQLKEKKKNLVRVPSEDKNLYKKLEKTSNLAADELDSEPSDDEFVSCRPVAKNGPYGISRRRDY